MRPAARAISATPSSRRPVACAIVRTSASDSPIVCGSSAITRGRDRQLGRERRDLVVGDRADRAQRLGHDQVGLELAQQVGVELVDRLAGGGALAHGGVDLAPRAGPRGSTSRVDVRERRAPRAGSRTRA